MNLKVHFKSERQNWKTPKAFYQALDSEFDFDFDPCPPQPKFDGLTCSWGDRNFVNPPYNEIEKWMLKAYREHKTYGRTVVMLIPSRTDTRWWHDYVMKAKEIRFIKGRLNFDGHKNSAPFPSCLVVFQCDHLGNGGEPYKNTVCPNCGKDLVDDRERN